MGDKLDSIEQLKQTEELLKQEKKREQAEQAKEAKPEPKTGEKTETRPEAVTASEANAKVEAKETKQKGEKKPEKKEEKKKKLVLERVYTIPFTKAYEKSRSHRGRIAVSLLRRFLARHAKASSPASIYVDQKVNSAVLARGSRRPPKKLRVLVQKDEEGKIAATLAA